MCVHVLVWYTRIYTCVPILAWRWRKGQGPFTWVKRNLLSWPIGLENLFLNTICGSFAFEAWESWVRAVWGLTDCPAGSDSRHVWFCHCLKSFFPHDLYLMLSSVAPGIRVWVDQDYSSLSWTSSNIFVCVPHKTFDKPHLLVHYKANICNNFMVPLKFSYLWEKEK